MWHYYDQDNYQLTATSIFRVIMCEKYETNQVRQDNAKQINCAGIYV